MLTFNHLKYYPKRTVTFIAVISTKSCLKLRLVLTDFSLRFHNLMSKALSRYFTISTFHVLDFQKSAFLAPAKMIDKKSQNRFEEKGTIFSQKTQTFPIESFTLMLLQPTNIQRRRFSL